MERVGSFVRIGILEFVVFKSIGASCCGTRSFHFGAMALRRNSIFSSKMAEFWSGRQQNAGCPQMSQIGADGELAAWLQTKGAVS